MARDGVHFFMVFLVIWISSFEKVLFNSVAHFFIGSVSFEEFSFLSSLFILVISSLIYSYQRFFNHSVGGLFHVETICFVVQKLFNFM
jgi:hypothetical protein